MDPNRHNPYAAYGPPPGLYGMPPRPGYPPVPPGVMPPYGPPRGGPGGFGRPPPRFHMRPPPISAPPPQESDKLTTLFVGAIAAGISDGWIERLLKTCGSLTSWKRVKDQSGNPKGFGFATYEDPESVLRALRILGAEGESFEGLTLTAQDGSGVQKKLIVKADDNVRNHLDQYKQSNMQTDTDDGRDTEAQQQVEKIVDAINSGQDPETPTEGTPADTEMEAAEDQEDIVSKELAAFRERAAMRDESPRQTDVKPRDPSRSRERRTSSIGRDSRDSSREPRGRRGDRFSSRQEFVRGPSEYVDEFDEEDDDEDDEEKEQKRLEKHAKEVEIAFRQREKRFEAREDQRIRDYQHYMQRMKEQEEREQRNKEVWAKRLAEYDDEVAIQRGEDHFYVDRSRWRKMRENVRRHEEDRDEEDRRAEAFEIEEKRRALEEEGRRRKEAEARQHAEEASRIAIKPTKLNFNMPIKRVTNMGTGEDDEDDEEGGKKRRVLVPLDYGDELTLDEAPHMDAEERTRRVKELIGSIPSSEQELWDWPVKWDELDEDLLANKLQPFISKKIEELIGVREEALIGFVLEFVRKHEEPPRALVTELEMTMDEEALVFVMKLWRALIFETERKSLKL
ncbi:uncharacterized protein BYT42DRAFT_567103 [Radiomyces spectabilis]|uniref:uncharacterized protein n=1 Tax=Radiomyces spectabilis TaxID=64574 RepID=UPI002220A066|nr:uncharacterized protein BYT42DRAFT_567103 [Radiomyces spectabilis]KAI8381593.1 hypothetical protein BYT42DRAFT_567103 [Radiomyces spectabilis]